MFKFVKYMIVVTAIVTPTFLGQNVALTNGGFSASCPKMSVNPNGSFLGAKCYTNNKTLVDNVLPLDPYIVNNDGNLVWQEGGGFSTSVQGCNLEGQSTTILRCQARKRDGSYVDASITLDDQIASYDGKLTVIDEQQIAKPKYDLKVTTTKDFEDRHLAKDRDEALKKAQDRTDGGDLLHYMKRTDLSSLPDALKRKFKKELSEEDFKTPSPDIGKNNYWTGLTVTVWEYDKKTNKLNDRTVELCLGLIQFHVNKENKTVEIGVHHIQEVR